VSRRGALREQVRAGVGECGVKGGNHGGA
jgi:hypothetical protein